MPHTLKYRRSLLANASRKKLIIFQQSLYAYYADMFNNDQDAAGCMNEFKDTSVAWKEFCHSVTEYNALKV